MAVPELERLLGTEYRNAVLSWALVGVVALVWIGELVRNTFFWSLFALVVLVLAVIPPIAYRSRFVMLPWEVLLVAALPVIGLAIESAVLSSQFTAYVSAAAIATVIVVELQSFTAVRLSTGFAVVLVAVATMATAALWGLVQWGFDVAFGTSHVTTNEALMYEFFYSTVAGIGAGIVFAAYIRRHVTVEDRLPVEVAEGFRE